MSGRTHLHLHIAHLHLHGLHTHLHIPHSHRLHWLHRLHFQGTHHRDCAHRRHGGGRGNGDRLGLLHFWCLAQHLEALSLNLQIGFSPHSHEFNEYPLHRLKKLRWHRPDSGGKTATRLLLLAGLAIGANDRGLLTHVIQVDLLFVTQVAEIGHGLLPPVFSVDNFESTAQNP